MYVVFHGPKEPVYTISVAARLLGASPQFLRQVENEGLISPFRTESNIRLYSDDDLRLLSRIVYLCRERGVNLQGVRVILAMEDGGRDGPDDDPPATGPNDASDDDDGEEPGGEWGGMLGLCGSVRSGSKPPSPSSRKT
ncbi:MAG TPA: MerR family transcriptional regulator [Firmicutes bacterium]|jgi:MerR family transcriptional regulator/heat shock protein HspR|nr:MerR family transcriptional regulator [Candidatus Fermentithermobacillaceae bacterium]